MWWFEKLLDNLPDQLDDAEDRVIDGLDNVEDKISDGLDDVDTWLDKLTG